MTIATMKSQPQHPKAQRGVALAVSLVLLVAMTIVAVATLSGTRINERIASNAQQKAISFEAAESAIGSTWTVDAMLDSLTQIPIDQFNNPQPVEPTGLNAKLSAAFDQTSRAGGSKSIDITATASIQYCGETALPSGSDLSADESKLQYAGAVFDVNGTGAIAGSKAYSDHVQRGYVVRPKTGRTGNCTIPGI